MANSHPRYSDIQFARSLNWFRGESRLRIKRLRPQLTVISAQGRREEARTQSFGVSELATGRWYLRLRMVWYESELGRLLLLDKRKSPQSLLVLAGPFLFGII